MVVNVYVVGKDCIDHLKVFIDHYFKCFPGCNVYYFDNQSTDNSLHYAKERGAITDSFYNYDEDNLKNFKNEIWKKHPGDWNIVCDIDELLNIDQLEVSSLPEDVNIICSRGWQVHADNPKLFYKSSLYNKCIMFKSSVDEINYSYGAHEVRPVNAVYAKKKYILKHMGFRKLKLTSVDIEHMRNNQPANIHRLYTLYTKERKIIHVILYTDYVKTYITGNEKLVAL